MNRYHVYGTAVLLLTVLVLIAAVAVFGPTFGPAGVLISVAAALVVGWRGGLIASRLFETANVIKNYPTDGGL